MDGANSTARQSHFVGVLFVVTASVCFSSAGVFTKGVTADAWTVIFWRGLFAALFVIIYVAYKRRLGAELSKMGVAGIWIAIICSLGSVSFIFAFKLTTVANVAVIYAVAPLMAALLSWVWLRERPLGVVMLSSTIACLGVIVLVGQSSGGNLRGDIYAVWMTLAAAIMMVIYRRNPETPAAGPAILSLIILLPISLAMGKPMSTPFNEIVTIAIFGLVFAFAVVALNEGSRRLASAEAALLSLLETPLAPLWAWLILSENPSRHAYIGGGIVVCAVLWAQWCQLRPQNLKR
jgi:drug/metabolite transporter (DMT)-like permease